MNEHISAQNLVPDPAVHGSGSTVAIRTLQIATLIGEILLSAYALAGNGWGTVALGTWASSPPSSL